MVNEFIYGKSINTWIKEYSIIKDLVDTKEVFWLNKKYTNFEKAMDKISLGEDDVKDAEDRLLRFAPLIAKLFPETEKLNGIIESPLIEIPKMRSKIETIFNTNIPNKLLLKCDSHLAIAGSIKARGGIYEVLKHAETTAMENGLLHIEDDYSKLSEKKYRDFFSKYTIQVGSTGNLGLSIGITSAKIGFNVIVHMSKDAKQWKKDLLRSKGVTVMEYESDYSKAVEEGRKLSNKNPNSYFIDDENSKDLFLGYSVAARRLKKQLEEMNIVVDSEHPLFVYLPCGVGGGPGGVAFGLKLVFKDNVHCFFAEPTHSPCMLMGMATEMHQNICVQDFGIDNITAADGLAVGRPSGFVGKTLEELLSGIYTIDDEKLHSLLKNIRTEENIKLEPSACAGLIGPVKLMQNINTMKSPLYKDITTKLPNSTHICWATGGSLVPDNTL
ncbi:D-serine ammonia-lyase, partial [Clostridium sp. KNHs214]|uniref:D-serine ammonia-lyase n=1 Tax=Clostridium sp. KNHs214 TaxID=1540257 RepID=UPI0005527594